MPGLPAAETRNRPPGLKSMPDSQKHDMLNMFFGLSLLPFLKRHKEECMIGISDGAKQAVTETV